jgi:hypothetical protein
MSFLDSLENNLKSLEAVPDAELVGREEMKRNAERARQNAIAPWAEQLKSSPFTAELMSVATREGHRRRTKIYISWIGPVLRLEARERRLELRPTADGIHSVFLVNNEETETKPADLKSDPAALIGSWLS